MSDENNSSRKPQVPARAYAHNYDNERRWSSYWLQIDRALKFACGGRLLEIGIGNGVVSSYLRTVGNVEIITADLDSDLNPDVTADITHLPFENRAFECVLACQVLEHLPLNQSSVALAELRRVANHAVISVPHMGYRRIDVHLRIGTRYAGLVSLPYPRPPWKRDSISTPNHFWEIGLDGFALSDFIEILQGAGWRPREEFRNPAFPYHHFFVLD